MKDGDHLHWVRMQVERPSFLFPEEMFRMFGCGFFGVDSSGGQLRNGEVLSGYALMIPL